MLQSEQTSCVQCSEVKDDFRTHLICVADATLDESSSLLYLAGLKEKATLEYMYKYFKTSMQR